VVAHSPAAAAFHPGDVIIGVTRPRTAVKAGPFGPALIDEIATHHAGDWVRFTVHRGAQYLRVTLKLGSRIDPSAASTLPSTDDKIAVV
jgi:S1-C subfamily serine protease